MTGAYFSTQKRPEKHVHVDIRDDLVCHTTVQKISVPYDTILGTATKH